MMDIYNTERAECLNLIAKQYEFLVLRIARDKQAGLCAALVEVLPGWEQEIVGQWRDGLELCHDRTELLHDDEKAAEFVLTLPKELKKMAFLCSSKQAVKHACELMRLRERLAAIKKKLLGDDRNELIQ